MRILSIRAKLTAWYTSLITLTFVLAGCIAYGLLSYSLKRDTDAALKKFADVIVQKTRFVDAFLPPAEVDDLYRRFFGFAPADRHVGLFDPLGRRDPHLSPSQSEESFLGTQALKNASQGLPTFETIASTGNNPERFLTVPVMENGRLANLIRVGISLENIYKPRRRFFLMMAYVLPFALLLAVGGGWLLARRALKPVDPVTATAQPISDEHLNERLQETGSGDELDRLAQTLNHMFGQLDDALHQMHQLSAGTALKLQTPLNALKSELEAALSSQKSTAEYKRVLKKGLKAIEEINHLAEGLLVLARADTGLLRLELRPVVLKELVQETCEQMQDMAAAHSIRLQLGALAPISLRGDRVQLRRLLLHLMENAIKYTPVGGSVTLTIQSDDPWASLKIADTGIGLSKKELRRISNRFQGRTDTRSGDEKGLGLGLSIAQTIAEAHGGHIGVESTPGQGSTFTVLLPMNPSRS